MKKEKYEISDNRDFLTVVYYIYESLTEYEIGDQRNEQYYGLDFLVDLLLKIPFEEKVKIIEKVIAENNLNYELNPNYFIDFDEDDPNYDPRYPEDDFDLIDYALRKFYDDEIELEDLEDEDE